MEVLASKVQKKKAKILGVNAAPRIEYSSQSKSQPKKNIRVSSAKKPQKRRGDSANNSFDMSELGDSTFLQKISTFNDLS